MRRFSQLTAPQSRMSEAALLACSLRSTCEANTERFDYADLAALLVPLSHQLDELEVLCAGCELDAVAEQSNRYISALQKLLWGCQGHTEPCVLAELISPVADALDAAELTYRRADA
ncbi:MULTISPECIES: hypothetical protein [Aeromonas]|uniref:Uncharacterized protein n=1 Tax=Aeromonas schubertii TaxID=652 RepID=A0ABS7VGL6_9GAMM|nr:hypothetical protein [Aeromonas schubertii]MBZ6068545.1 hypothetical protein [Aeromonas schubertii]